MKRAVFFDREDNTLSVEIRYVLEDPTKFELFNVANGYTPKKGDTIYLMPGVNIPRAKLKDLALNQGIKIVRDAENANIIISGRATPGKILHGNWYYTTPIPKTEEYIDKLDNVDEYYKDNLRTALMSSESNMVYHNYGTRRDMKELINYADLNGSTHFYYINDEWKQLIDDCQNKDVYYESELLAMINGEDAITITNEIYDQLCEMFRSSDQDNHIMAMEIMANSNYVESALYLMLLLEEYGDKISECHTKHHINFKSLVSYFGIKVGEVQYMDPDDVTKKLITLNLLTTEWLNILLASRITWFVKNIPVSTTFNVASIVPTPAVAAAINSEYRAEVSHNDDKSVNLDFAIGLDDLSTSPTEELIPNEDTELQVEEPIFTEEEDAEIGEALARLERKELKAKLIALDNDNTEVILKTESESNNHQIKQTNESTNIDWI
jgi:hypothetical protein